MLVYYIVMPVAWVLVHLGWRIEFRGLEKLQPYKDGKRGFVLVPNHLHEFDPVFIALGCWMRNRMNILAKEELFKNKLIGWFLGCCGAVPIARGKGDTDTLDGIVADCKKGKGLLIFAEGTRSKTGKIGPIKGGAFVIAGQAGVDMIPCRIIYGTEKGFLKPFCRIRVCFGDPIPAEQLQIADPKQSIKALRGLKRMLSDKWEELYQQNFFPEYPRPAELAPAPEKPRLPRKRSTESAEAAAEASDGSTAAAPVQAAEAAGYDSSNE